MNDKRLSQRRACRLMTQPRGTQRRILQSRRDDGVVESWLVELANDHGAWGCPQLHQQLRREGHRINHKRTQRLYRKHGLSLRRRSRRRLPERVQRPLVQQLYPSQVWSMDFMSDTLVNRRAYRTFNVIDDCARDVLAIEIDFSLTGERVVRVLQTLCEWHGKPDVMHSDNGPELTSFAVEKRLAVTSCRRGQNPAVSNGSSPNPVVQHRTRTSNDSTARSVSKYSMPINSRASIRLVRSASSGSRCTTSTNPQRHRSSASGGVQATEAVNRVSTSGWYRVRGIDQATEQAE